MATKQGISIVCHENDLPTTVVFLAPLPAHGHNVPMNDGMITNLSEAKMVRFVDEAALNGLGENAKISYSRIKGSPFWGEQWKEADLYTESGKIETAPVKLNLATDEIYFLKNGGEWVLQDKDIDWIEEKKLGFKREVDLLQFLQFYNSKLPNAPE